jgi:hypothetical protein
MMVGVVAAREFGELAPALPCRWRSACAWSHCGDGPVAQPASATHSSNVAWLCRCPPPAALGISASRPIVGRPGAGVDPASFRDYKPGGARNGTRRARSFWRLRRMKQIIRELKRQVVGEKLEPEQLKGLIRAGYVYRNSAQTSSTHSPNGRV